MPVDRLAVGVRDGLPHHFHSYLYAIQFCIQEILMIPSPQISFPLFLLHIRFSDHEIGL
jgi:hypothetical protein